jgi:hypothetical protein
MVYYKKKINQNTNKQNPSELLNSKKTKKRLLITGGYKSNSKNEAIDINTKDTILSNNNHINHINNNHTNSKSNYLYEETDIQEGGGYKKSKELVRILAKSYKTFHKLQDKYFPKMLLIKDELFDPENKKKGISRIQRMVNHILDIEERLHFFNNPGETKETQLANYDTGIDELKTLKKWYKGKWWKFDVTLDRRNIFKLGISRINKSELEKRFRKLQDFIRKKLMKNISFDKVSDITNCRKWHLVTKKDSLMCNIKKFRKLERKFNTYYKKFQSQYIEFIKKTNLSCDELTQYKTKLDSLSSSSSSSIALPERFDFTLCNENDNLLNKLNKASETIYTKLKADNEKLKSMNKSSLTNFQKKYDKTIMKSIKKAKKQSKIQKEIEKNQEKMKYITEVSNDIKKDLVNYILILLDM